MKKWLKSKTIFYAGIICLIFAFIVTVKPEEKSTNNKDGKVEIKRDKSVGATANQLGYFGMDSRGKTYAYADSTAGVFKFESYVDYCTVGGSWTDASGNPYVKVGYRVDTSGAAAMVANKTASFFTTIPNEIDIIVDSISVSSINMTYSLSDNKIKGLMFLGTVLWGIKIIILYIFVQ